MVEYDQFKVSELKDLLRKRNVSPSGTKSELISRLKDLDAQEAAEKESAAAPESEAEPEKAEEPTAEQSAAATTAAAAAEEPAAPADATEDAVAEPKPEAAEAPKAPVLSDDELLAQIKADLEKQIQRAKRFGSDGSELEARLKRINKFGIAAVRDAAQKVEAKLSEHRRSSRKRGKKFQRGPKPATA